MRHRQSAHAIPSDPLHRTAFVQAELKMRGLSFSALARQAGVSKKTVSQAMFVPNFGAEQLIAEAIEIDPMDLFPERYRDGRRLHAVKGSRAPSGSQRSKERAA